MLVDFSFIQYSMNIVFVLAIILSILCCLTGVGTLTFVDPAGRGGLRRLFQMDPASLINLSTLIAVLLSAVCKSTVYGLSILRNVPLPS